jgi:HD-like signal output (HDOD) protein
VPEQTGEAADSAPVAAMLDPRVSARVDAALTGGAVEIPVLGDAVARLVAEANNPDADVRKLADLVRRDPALAGNLLSLANSTWYVGREPAATLHQAVARLGTSALRDIALVVAARARAFSVPGRAAEMRARFGQAFAGALFAQDIARSRRLGVEEAFLIGLFHDVGWPIALQVVVRAARETGVELSDGDANAAADALHAEVGARAITSWRLDPNVAEAARWHHDWASGGRGAALAALANTLATAALEPCLETEAAVRAHEAREVIGLYDDDIERLLAAAPRVAMQVREVA